MSDEREAMAAAIETILSPKSLRVLHKAIVVDQDADGNLGVKMPSDAAPSATAKPVPLWLGLPGFSARMRTSATPEVSVGFHEGSEAGAYAALFPTYPQGVRSSADLPVDYISFGGGTLPIARKTDRVDCGQLIIRNLPPLPGPIPAGIVITRKGSTDPLELETAVCTIVGPIQMIAVGIDPNTCVIDLLGRITSGRVEFLA